MHAVNMILMIYILKQSYIIVDRNCHAQTILTNCFCPYCNVNLQAIKACSYVPQEMANSKPLQGEEEHFFSVGERDKERL